MSELTEQELAMYVGTDTLVTDRMATEIRRLRPLQSLVREYFAALDGWAEHPTDDAHTRLHAADIALRREAGCDAVHVTKVAEMGGER